MLIFKLVKLNVLKGLKMEELYKAIRKARKDAKLNQKDLGEKIGVTASAITQFESKPETDKRVVRPSLENLYAIAEATDTSIVDFFPNADENKKQIVKNELKANLSEYLPYLPDNLQLKDFVVVKKLDILAGAGSEGVFDIAMLNSNSVVVVERRVLGRLNPANIRAIEIIGDSMEPEYTEGDIALIDMVNYRYDFVKIAGIYVVRCNEAVYIKRVEFLPEGGLKLMSLNRDYGDIILGIDDNFEILGKVCGKIHYEINKGLIFDNQGIR